MADRVNGKAIPKGVYTAAELAVRGKSVVEIAEIVVEPVHIVHGWTQRFPTVYRDAAIRLMAPELALRELVPLALAVMKETLETEPQNAADRAVRLQAAQDVQDRYYGRAVQRQQIDTRSDIRVIFKSVDADLGRERSEQTSETGRPGGPAFDTGRNIDS